MNCYQSERKIKPFDLLVATETDFDLTRNRVYVAKSIDFPNHVAVVNDKGELEIYSPEFFRFYNGEKIDL